MTNDNKTHKPFLYLIFTGLPKVEDTSQQEIESKKINYSAIKCKDGEIVNFKDYFFTEHWRKIRTQYKSFSMKTNKNKKCEKCGCEIKNKITLHHLTYENIGNERDDELMYLCFDCHGEVHGKPKTTYKQRREKFKEVKENSIIN